MIVTGMPGHPNISDVLKKPTQARWKELSILTENIGIRHSKSSVLPPFLNAQLLTQYVHTVPWHVSWTLVITPSAFQNNLKIAKYYVHQFFFLFVK